MKINLEESFYLNLLTLDQNKLTSLIIFNNVY